MNTEDKKADIKMRFQQIISVLDLMLENNSQDSINLLTIREIAEKGLNIASDL